MPPQRKISIRQVELLVEFIEMHRDIATGQRAGGPEGSLAARDAWRTVALKLNSLGKGAVKTGEQWRRYWIELKAKIKNKAADCRRTTRGTGGGPNRLLPITPIEKKILALIGGSSQPEEVKMSQLKELSLESTRQAREEVVPQASDTGQNSPSPHSATPRGSRRVSQQTTRGNVLNWAYQLETRRLEVEQQHAEALQQCAKALQQQAAAMVQMADTLERIESRFS